MSFPKDKRTLSISTSTLFAVLTSALICLGCGPKPGTPEYVLQQIEAGEIVGQENLLLLTQDHLHAMLALIDQPQTERVAKQQLIIRATSFKLDNAATRFAPYLSNEEPDVRIHIVGWMSTQSDPQVIALLIKQLDREPEEIVRVRIAGALATAASRKQADQDEVAGQLIEKAQAAPPARKGPFIVALGGYPTDKSLAFVREQLTQKSPAISGAAAKAVIIASQQEFDKTLPLLPTMINHPFSGIRRDALRILWESVHQAQADACRTDLAPSIVTEKKILQDALNKLLSGGEAHPAEKELIGKILSCLDPAAPTEAATAS